MDQSCPPRSSHPPGSSHPPPPGGSVRSARRGATARVISALMLREMSTTYGRSSLGYLWAILEPVAGILLMSFVFSLAFRAPGIGTSFPLFFASGMLPFLAYAELNQKLSTALRFSKALLFYPGVTFVDALVARLVINAITLVFVSTLVLTGVIWVYDLDVILDPPKIALGFAMAVALGTGIGVLNCFLLSVYPVWERTWAILNRPLFILSCVIFLFDAVPQPYRDWLWWNPLVHCVGQVRSGIYATYDATYVSPVYVFALSGVALALGLLLLRRHAADILNT